jgi:hypothetical protein
MKAVSRLSTRFDIPGLCLIAALAAACSFDTNQLRALPDGAIDPTVPDVGAAGSDVNSTSPPDALTATGGSGGSSGASGTAGAGRSGGQSGAGGTAGSSGGTTSIGGTRDTGAGTAGTGGGARRDRTTLARTPRF